MTTEQSVILRDQAGTLYEVPLSALDGYRVSAERHAEIEAALSPAPAEQEVQGYYDSSIVVPTPPTGQDAANSKTGGGFYGSLGAAEGAMAIAVVGVVGASGAIGAIDVFSRPPF